MLSILLAMSAPALAESPYMWGIGPEVGTIVLPFEHPVAFPGLTEDADLDDKKDDLGDSLEKTTGDALIGAKGALYINDANRILTQVGFGLGGAGYRSSEVTFEYQALPISGSGVEAFAGAGLGFGRMSWTTECDNDSEGVSATCEILHPGTYQMSTLLLRGSVGALWRNKTQAYELSFWGHYVIAGNRTFVGQDSSAEEEISGVGLYPYLGIAGTVYFGDFKPPAEGKNKKGKGKKNSDA